MDIVLKVYEDDMETVKKECVAATVKVPFGLIRKLMKLFDVETLEDTTQILNVVLKSWEDVTALLDRIFPDISEEDWDYVDTNELVRAIFKLLKFALAEMIKIPTEKN